MQKYYTRACNFYYGMASKKKIKKKQALPISGNSLISFDKIELITRKSKKLISINKINTLPKHIKKKVNIDINNITKKKYSANLNFSNFPLIMGVINLTPDSFSDGGKFTNKISAYKQLQKLINNGANIIDVGGESTRPGAKDINTIKEWKRINPILKILKNKKYFISLDTRKSLIMKKSLSYNINLINDVSCFEYDNKTIDFLKKSRLPFIIHHMKGNPKTMQLNPRYNDVILDIYDFFEKKINFIRLNKIKHNNIILDPGIGFGKNLKHNITLINKISIFHSLGFPVMLGVSRKRFIKDLSGTNDSKDRIGGTVASCLYSLLQGVQIIRVHDVNEINQALKVFKKLQFNL